MLKDALASIANLAPNGSGAAIAAAIKAQSCEELQANLINIHDKGFDFQNAIASKYKISI